MSDGWATFALKDTSQRVRVSRCSSLSVMSLDDAKK